MKLHQLYKSADQNSTIQALEAVMPEVVFLHVKNKNKNTGTGGWRNLIGSCCHKRSLELLKSCCHGNHLATPHLPCDIHIKLQGNQIGKYILTPLVRFVDRD